MYQAESLIAPKALPAKLLPWNVTPPRYPWVRRKPRFSVHRVQPPSFSNTQKQPSLPSLYVIDSRFLLSSTRNPYAGCEHIHALGCQRCFVAPVENIIAIRSRIRNPTFLDRGLRLPRRRVRFGTLSSCVTSFADPGSLVGRRERGSFWRYTDSVECSSPNDSWIGIDFSEGISNRFDQFRNIEFDERFSCS